MPEHREQDLVDPEDPPEPRDLMAPRPRMGHRNQSNGSVRSQRTKHESDTPANSCSPNYAATAPLRGPAMVAPAGPASSISRAFARSTA
jgi:hypothetical protein